MHKSGMSTRSKVRIEAVTAPGEYGTESMRCRMIAGGVSESTPSDYGKVPREASPHS